MLYFHLWHMVVSKHLNWVPFGGTGLEDGVQERAQYTPANGNEQFTESW